MDVYALSKLGSKYIKQQLTELQGDILKSVKQRKVVKQPFQKLTNHGSK